jgi:hypothetical protein
MQKLIYPFWKPSTVSIEQFRDQLLSELSPKLIAAGSRHLRFCFADKDVAPAAPYRIVSEDTDGQSDPVDGVITLWLDSYLRRAPFEAMISEAIERFSGYLVWESEPLVNTAHVAAIGERTPGMNEVVFLRKPERLTHEEWLTVWHESHTWVAIDTQSTFGYRQNVVIRSLTDKALKQDAIIEENFPKAALHSRMAFYDAGENRDQYKAREREMVESCARFIDFDNMDCIPMSEYIMQR